MSRLTMPTALTLIACVLGAPSALAAEVGVDGHPSIGAQQPAQESVLSLSEAFGMEFVPVALHVLPPQDNEFFMTEDVILGNGTGQNPYRFAVPTPAALELGSGEKKTKQAMCVVEVLEEEHASLSLTRMAPVR